MLSSCGDHFLIPLLCHHSSCFTCFILRCCYMFGLSNVFYDVVTTSHLPALMLSSPTEQARNTSMFSNSITHRTIAVFSNSLLSSPIVLLDPGLSPVTRSVCFGHLLKYFFVPGLFISSFIVAISSNFTPIYRVLLLSLNAATAHLLSIFTFFWQLLATASVGVQRYIKIMSSFFLVTADSICLVRVCHSRPFYIKYFALLVETEQKIPPCFWKALRELGASLDVTEKSHYDSPFRTYKRFPKLKDSFYFGVVRAYFCWIVCRKLVSLSEIRISEIYFLVL